jgi:hypothetical protein
MRLVERVNITYCRRDEKSRLKSDEADLASDFSPFHDFRISVPLEQLVITHLRAQKLSVIHQMGKMEFVEEQPLHENRLENVLTRERSRMCTNQSTHLKRPESVIEISPGMRF